MQKIYLFFSLPLWNGFVQYIAVVLSQSPAASHTAKPTNYYYFLSLIGPARHLDSLYSVFLFMVVLLLVQVVVIVPYRSPPLFLASLLLVASHTAMPTYYIPHCKAFWLLLFLMLNWTNKTPLLLLLPFFFCFPPPPPSSRPLISTWTRWKK